MGIRSGLVLACSLGMFCVLRTTTAFYYNLYSDMETRCNQSVVLDCPYLISGRAGTIRYQNIPVLSRESCWFTLTLDSSCGKPQMSFAFYFNVRKFNLPYPDALRIYENWNGFRGLVMQLADSMPQYRNPSSVAQALTAYVKQPSVTFEYMRRASYSSSVHEVIVDFVIVEDTSHSRNTFCGALQGYVNDNFICDNDGINDRVNCPLTYAASVDGNNPARGTQCLREATTSIFNDRNNNLNQGSSATGLNSGAISGISVGVAIVVFFTILAGIIYLVRSRGRRTPLHSFTTTTPRNANTSQPVSGTHDAPFAPSPPFTDLPPSYAEAVGSVEHATSAIPPTPTPRTP
ncbi:uncharacterized protein LOC129596531 [Paramacrobiotus metropolitanus]|uniref:uncharacterized protein LOC129596531 n=1 Tax=Paramacrobiotus metropolitanus TaxID=2943436 RepID=UPI002445E1B9|nr:uncharacterized protein LOC129596531 [Paramacrobiotus metropolitanus]